LVIDANLMIQYSNGSIFLAFQKEQSVLGVISAPSAIKVVQIKKKRAVPCWKHTASWRSGLMREWNRQATSLPVDKIVEALKDILKEAKTTTIYAERLCRFHQA